MATPIDKKELSEEELEVYSRQIVLSDIGYEGQLKLRNAKICIIGLGGLGCPTAIQLTAMGVGYLRLVDRDVVERSNLHRQHLYDVNSLGYPKVEVAAKKLNELNPDVEMDLVPLSLNVDNAEDVIKGVDVVIDGLDRIEPRYVINRACVKLRIPYVFGAAIESFGNVSTIVPNDTPCLECFYPDLHDEVLPTCAIAGVHPSVLGIVSSLQVSEAIRLIIGEKPHLINKLLYCDLRNMAFDEIPVARLEACPVCGKSTNPPRPLRRKFIEEVCGRGGKRVYVIVPKENLEINMEDLHRLLIGKQLPIKVRANLGITFNINQKIAVSVLKSGIMIVEGANQEEQAFELYKTVINDLGISWSSVE